MVAGRADPRTAASWLQGRRAYADRPLAEVAADLSRAYKHPVTVAPDAADLRFSGVLVLDDEDAVMERLTSFLPVRAAREDGGIRLERR
jgi:transmembrane sensor